MAVLTDALFKRGRDAMDRVLPQVWVDEVLTFKRRAGGDTYPTPITCHGKRSMLDKRDLRVGMGLVPAGTIVFLIHASDITGAMNQHDKITGADGLDYFITFAQLIVMDGKFWRCETVRGAVSGT